MNVKIDMENGAMGNRKNNEGASRSRQVSKQNVMILLLLFLLLVRDEQGGNRTSVT